MSLYWYSTSNARPIKKKKKLAMHANNSWQFIYHSPLRATIHGSNTPANQLIENDIKKFKQNIETEICYNLPIVLGHRA